VSRFAIMPMLMIVVVRVRHDRKTRRRCRLEGQYEDEYERIK
jgi:hypothetical protein